ncbi:MAG TPA: DUF3710 domain-containing protein [Pseudonocardiaceae bacterium]
MFGRRRKARHEPLEDDPDFDPDFDGDGGPADEEYAEYGEAAGSGPYDEADAPGDDLNRLDLGSMRLPIPDGAQLQVEVDQSGPVRAVHLITEAGQVTVTVFAAPRSGGLWREVSKELVSRLRADGARVARVRGEWGDEIDAATQQGHMRFLGVEGPRWMLRGVAVGAEEQVEDRLVLLRDVVRETVVVRGADPMPVRSQLPLILPEAIAEQLKQATAGPADPGAER